MYMNNFFDNGKVIFQCQSIIFHWVILGIEYNS